MILLPNSLRIIIVEKFMGFCLSQLGMVVLLKGHFK